MQETQNTNKAPRLGRQVATLALGAFGLSALLLLALVFKTQLRVRVEQSTAPASYLIVPGESTVEDEREGNHSPLRPVPLVPKTPPDEILIGDVRVSGQVVDRRSSVPDAVVWCVPSLIDSAVSDECGNLRMIADSHGRFRFEALPKAHSYRFHAVSGAAYGTAVVTRESARQGVVVRLSALRYNRFLLFDARGAPVDVSGVALGIGRGSVLASSERVVGASPGLRALERVLGRADGPAPNEIRLFYRDNLLEPRAESLHLPGYEAQTLEMTRRDLSEWPSATSVTLQSASGSDLVRHQVVFPKLAWPEAWGEPDAAMDVFLNVEVGSPNVEGSSPNREYLLSRRVHTFFARADATLKITTLRGYEMSSSRKSIRGRVLVSPDFPAMGFVTLIRRAGRNHLTPHMVYAASTDGPRRHYARFTWPGLVRMGPLPVGEYKIRVAETIQGLADGPERVLGETDPVRVTEGGHRVVAWPDYR